MYLWKVETFLHDCGNQTIDGFKEVTYLFL